MQQMLAQGMSDQGGQRDLIRDSKCLNMLVDDGGHRIPEIVKLTNEAGVTLESVELHKPTLDDVFLSVTGRNIRDERGSFVEMVRRHRILRQARGKRVRG
jgi:ABC-2 type transport system ATP-binding protein